MQNGGVKIGMFDSGVGGLFTLCGLRAVWGGDVVFLADSKNMPFGSKSRVELISILESVFDFFVQRRVDILIIACNTTAAVLLDEPNCVPPLAKFKIFNVLESAAKKAALFKKVGLLATPYTVQSFMYEKMILGQNPGCRVISVACPLWAPLIEAGAESVELREVAFACLEQFPREIEAIVLGCTHYSILEHLVADFFGNSVKIIDSASEIFSDRSFPVRSEKILNVEFFVTGNVQQFVSGGLRVCDLSFENVQCVKL